MTAGKIIKSIDQLFIQSHRTMTFQGWIREQRSCMTWPMHAQKALPEAVATKVWVGCPDGTTTRDGPKSNEPATWRFVSKGAFFLEAPARLRHDSCCLALASCWRGSQSIAPSAWRLALLILWFPAFIYSLFFSCLSHDPVHQQASQEWANSSHQSAQARKPPPPRKRVS